MSKDAFVWKK